MRGWEDWVGKNSGEPKTGPELKTKGEYQYQGATALEVAQSSGKPK